MPEKPNIVWMTLDSVRADHTTMGGYRRDTTPEQQRIATDSKGNWYSNCFAHSNNTRVSVPSMLTGTYPSHHCVRKNHSLPSALNTVPELLSAEGYRTIGLSRNANSSLGIAKGFDEFKWISAGNFLDAVDLRTAVKYLFNIRRHSAGFSMDTAKHATPFIINDMAKRRVRAQESGGDPFFMYLHYNEPHRPYFPPLSYLEKYIGEIELSASEAVDVAMDMHYNSTEKIAEGLQYSQTEWEALYALYDAEIAYTDECVGRLFDYIQSRDVGKTIFVITADHGELFGERGMLAHKLVLHDELINVPLVTHGFSGLECASDDLVQHGDIMQTLVAMAGGNVGQFQGIDLRSETREWIISQDWERDDFLDEVTAINPNFEQSNYHRPLLTCLRDKRFKYQYSEQGEELFKLPDEKADVSELYPEVATVMAEELHSWLEDEGQPISDETRSEELSDAMREQLSELGYLVE